MARTLAAIIIDRDVESRFEMKQILRATGFTLAGDADFGQEAVSLATEVRPDVMIVALNDPMERPLQTIDSLLTLLPETPVVVYSESRNSEAMRHAMLAGVRDFLTLPVRPDVLRDSVVNAMAAEEHRRLRRMGNASVPSATGTVITVFGAKGGVGKSTVATNLAVSLAKQGTSTAIVDMDTGFGDVTAMLNVKAERTLGDLVRDLDNVDRGELRRYLARHESTGLDVLASPNVLEWRALPREELRRAIDLLARYYDKIVIDTSGSINDASEVALELATIVLWVTTTEFTSVRDSLEAMRALEALSLPKERTRFVLNSVSADDNVRPQTMRDVLQRDVFWQIPYDKRVRQGTHFGQPICVAAPQSVAARSFADLATVIAGGRAEGGRKRSGGVRWLAGMRPASAGN